MTAETNGRTCVGVFRLADGYGPTALCQLCGENRARHAERQAADPEFLTTMSVAQRLAILDATCTTEEKAMNHTRLRNGIGMVLLAILVLSVLVLIRTVLLPAACVHVPGLAYAWSWMPFGLSPCEVQ